MDFSLDMKKYAMKKPHFLPAYMNENKNAQRWSNGYINTSANAVKCVQFLRKFSVVLKDLTFNNR